MNFVKQIVSSAFIGFVLFYLAYVIDMGSFKMESEFVMVAAIISIVFLILFILDGIVFTDETSRIIPYQTVFGSVLFFPIYINIMDNLADSEANYAVRFIISMSAVFFILIVAVSCSIRHHYNKKKLIG
ncbi:hypothetical protein MKZ08_09170 [Viridibacillus sp. FSL R5-0477]|uniref:Uncharacterized protein n=1 Tax=Viridibacillus arenosi FSL R5-213 TaxID=1227360 RepID=W4F3E7_9BACL|nr:MULTISPECIES: hypothetical protein [Viridibacillus]ETT86847.1 hypothetical protein C176_09042 [Viridibacillus arenosi FSL R5-213]OMC83200.1 hypothetical protein BK128_18960 [Viridibacillus sp. FSL H7-0596]OMC83303.1 hypothetical protein BK130_07060 [Viridibacillus sp. FSL H8-0123]OMC88213.1 hypothetical protein BK137_19295 [Viridibacillus arenosi]